MSDSDKVLVEAEHVFRAENDRLYSLQQAIRLINRMAERSMSPDQLDELEKLFAYLVKVYSENRP